MEKDKSLSHGGGFPPPSGRYSSFPHHGSSFNMKPEQLPPSSSPSPFHQMSDFSHDISQMSDNPPKNLGHRRAHSEILTLPDDISFDSDLGVVGGVEPSLSDETDEDLLSMYLDMDKVNSSSSVQLGDHLGVSSGFGGETSSMETLVGGSSERPRVRHQHSQSMDGLSTINHEMLVSGPEGPPGIDMKKAISAAKLAEIALVDPKRAKRIWANRQSAARSKERKMRYIGELEQKLQTLRTESTSLSAQLTLLQRDTNGLNSENSELKLRLQTIEQQVHLQDALNDALKEEIQHLKVLTGQPTANGGQMTNFTSFGGAGQQFFPNNQAMNTHLTTQQLQQLRIHSQNQHQHQHHQFHQLHQQQLKYQHEQQQLQQQQFANLKLRGSMPSPGHKDNATDSNSPATKD